MSQFKSSVTPMGSTVYATVDDFKSANSGIDFDSITDEQIADRLEEASRAIDSFTDRIFYKAQVENEKRPVVQRYGDDSYMIYVRHRPIVSVQSIGVILPVKKINWTTESDWDIYHDQGYVDVYPEVFPTGFGYHGILGRDRPIQTLITYQTGEDFVPSVIKRATIVLVRNMLFPGQNVMGASKDQSMNAGTIKKVQSGSYTQEWDTSSTGGSSAYRQTTKANEDTLFTNDVREMLRPYIRTGVR